MQTGVPENKELSEAECRRRLAGGGVGRIALPGEGAPIIRPVNFLVHEGVIVIRTGEGALIRAGEHGTPASFEIDGIDPLEHTGWSVVVVGKIAIHPREDALGALPLRAWASGQKSRHVMISLDAISGLQIPSGKGNR